MRKCSHIFPFYRDRFRTLQFNLSKPDRVVIHQRIISGGLSTKEISVMSSTDLTDEDTKQSIKLAEKEALEHSILQKQMVPRLKMDEATSPMWILSSRRRGVKGRETLGRRDAGDPTADCLGATAGLVVHADSQFYELYSRTRAEFGYHPYQDASHARALAGNEKELGPDHRFTINGIAVLYSKQEPNILHEFG